VFKIQIWHKQIGWLVGWLNSWLVGCYRRGASDARVIAIIVYLSVTRRYCIKTAKRRITQTTPRDGPETL